MAFRTIWLEAGSPNLVRSLRYGYQAKPFYLLSFNVKSKGGNGLSRIGQLLLLTRLNTLPQLYNVLRGDMSFIGPRPLPEEHLGLAIELGTERFTMLPGITGMAQVQLLQVAKTENTWRQMIVLDDLYARNWSIGIDFLVLSRTVNLFLTKGPSHAIAPLPALPETAHPRRAPRKKLTHAKARIAS